MRELADVLSQITRITGLDIIHSNVFFLSTLKIYKSITLLYTYIKIIVANLKNTLGLHSKNTLDFHSELQLEKKINYEKWVLILISFSFNSF